MDEAWAKAGTDEIDNCPKALRSLFTEYEDERDDYLKGRYAEV